jgi:F0F1-type ATP synthase assembly protein I
VEGRSDAMNFVLGISGAVVGGTFGHFAFIWIVGQGFYALIIPGAALGLGFSAGFQRKTTAGALFCGIAAVGLGLFSEWCFQPFAKDVGFGFFLAHIQHLEPITLIMIVLGGVCAYWTVGSQRRFADRSNSDHQQS